MKFIKLLILLSASTQCGTTIAEKLSPEQVLQKVIDHYPSINMAEIEIERARQSIKVANSQLGWKLNAQAGIERGVNLLGTSNDIVSFGGGVSRMLDSGSSLAFDGGIRREDSETLLAPTFPNPATSTNIGISYRQSLAKNTAYSLFEESKISAQLDLESSKAKKGELYDQLATKVMGLYFSAATLLARIDNVEQSIKRTTRLQSYIKNKKSLGVSEEKDILQVNAQLDTLLAEKKKLNVTWIQQMVSLNRLMERPWDSDVSVIYKANSNDEDFDSLFIKAKKYSPAIQLLDARLAQADAAIQTRRDERENAMDLVWFAGGRNYQGDNVLGNISESEVTGGLRLEFKQDVDKSGVDAKLYQAQLQRSAILQDRKLLVQNLQYELAGLLAEIEANHSSIKAHEKSLKSETIKVDEAMKRYRSGRINTDVLIKFEDQLSLSRFSLELQRISLVQRHYLLKIKLGLLWHEIKKPEYQSFLSEPQLGSGAK